MTCVAEGDEIFFINYSSLGKGIKYVRYRIPYSTSTEVLTSESYDVDGESYSASDGTISLLPSYNQISVTSKINEYKELLPDVFDEKFLTNANGEWNKVLSYVCNGGSYYATSGVLSRYKFVTNPHYKTYYYDKTTKAQVVKDTCKTYPELQNYIGATLLQASFEDYNPWNIDGAFISNTDKSLTNYILIHQHDKSSNQVVFSSVAS